jgi:hypothetical protein
VIPTPYSNALKLFQYLSDGEFHTAAEIKKAIGVSPVEVRQIAQENPEDIIGLTQGYKLAQFATLRELRYAYHSLLSRAEKITQRAIRLRTAQGL